VLAILVVLTPLSVSLGWPSEASAILLFVTIGLLLLVGQTIIFLLRLVAADRRGRRRPLASSTPTVGEMEDASALDDASADNGSAGQARIAAPSEFRPDAEVAAPREPPPPSEVAAPSEPPPAEAAAHEAPPAAEVAAAYEPPPATALASPAEVASPAEPDPEPDAPLEPGSRPDAPGDVRQ
jgi:hypothetical protein